MAGEALLINPRRRRGRRRKARAKSRPRRARRARARRNPFAMTRRRRRGVRRRARGRVRRRACRARSNPRLPLIGSVNLQAIGGGFAGYVGTRYATTWALSFLPPEWKANPQTAPMVRIATKAVIGFAVLPMLAKMFKLRGVASSLAIGAGIAVMQDLVDTFAPNILPMPAGAVGLADYETQVLSEYEQAQLTGSADAYGSGAYGAGGYNF